MPRTCLYMTPSLPIDDAGYGTLPYTESFSKFVLAKLSRCVEMPNVMNSGLGENRPSVSFSTSLPLFAKHILHIILLISRKEMVRVITSRSIASMENVRALYRKGFVEMLVRNFMNSLVAVYLSVSIFIERIRPDEAVFGVLRDKMASSRRDQELVSLWFRHLESSNDSWCLGGCAASNSAPPFILHKLWGVCYR